VYPTRVEKVTQARRHRKGYQTTFSVLHLVLWDVTGLVQTWVNGAANHGLALMSKNETTLGWRGFASKESSVSPPSPPRLVVSYRP
jgi:hypothetical protein